MSSLTFISAAVQQAVALYRLSSAPNGLLKIRRVLCAHTRANVTNAEPRMWQLYIWQTLLLLLNSAIYGFVIGLAVLVWTAAKSAQYIWAADETKVGEITNIQLSKLTDLDRNCIHHRFGYICGQLCHLND